MAGAYCAQPSCVRERYREYMVPGTLYHVPCTNLVPCRSRLPFRETPYPECYPPIVSRYSGLGTNSPWNNTSRSHGSTIVLSVASAW